MGLLNEKGPPRGGPSRKVSLGRQPYSVWVMVIAVSMGMESSMLVRENSMASRPALDLRSLISSPHANRWNAPASHAASLLPSSEEGRRWPEAG